MNTALTNLLSTASANPRAIITCHLGRLPYAEAWDLQLELQGLVIEAKRGRLDATVPNFLLTVEHPSVYTMGKSGDVANLLASEDDLAREGVSFFHTDRGGDITYHGPGQLVGYPILDLDRYFTDVGRYLRTLEEVIINVCVSYGLVAGRVDGRTGVWIDVESGAERKICAFGIRCSRWVTMHGFAFNVNTELGFYDGIIPCGIGDRGVTSLAKELSREIDPDECRNRVLAAFEQTFDAKIATVQPGELFDLVETLRSFESVAQS